MWIYTFTFMHLHCISRYTFYILINSHKFVLFCSLDSGDERQPDLPCTSSKEVVCPPHTSKTPTPSVGDSVRPHRAGTPSKKNRGRYHSEQGTKRSASAISEDGVTERWKDCSVEDEVPALPNFLSKRNPGAQLVMDMIYSPLQLF